MATLALALAAALFVCAPRDALGRRVPCETASGAPGDVCADVTSDDAAASDASNDATADDPQQKRQESGGGLAAPFRALARLFGGGSKKAKTAGAKNSEQHGAANTSAQANGATRGEAANKSEAKLPVAQSAEAQATATPAARVQTMETPAAGVATAITSGAVGGSQRAEGVRVIRPGGGGSAYDPAAASSATASKPRIWIPVIEGISKDPLTQGRALLDHGYIQEAIAELSTAATVGPDLAEANDLLGLAYARLGWHLLAIECYERALSASPRNAEVLANLGSSLYLTEDYNGALRRLKQAAKLAPGTPVINNNLGVVEARLQHYGKAFKYFAAASSEYDAHVSLASILEQQKRDRDAIKHYEAALRLQPGTSAVLERLVALYERTGARDKADEARRTLGHPKNPQKTVTGGGG
jgi:Tfp pilus assembly protein PilF